MEKSEVKETLDYYLHKYNNYGFIPLDPISIPHRFKKKEDIEIAGFFAAIFAWGQRKTIVNKCNDLIARMDNAPYHFILNASKQELTRLSGFVHRTFQEDDLNFLIKVLKEIYQEYTSLEDIFTLNLRSHDHTIENGLIGFQKFIFERPYALNRTKKHIATPLKNSTCKRLNMFLRWMVRSDDRPVDFGIWQKIKPSQLICPVDVHVERVARELKLITGTQKGWKLALELTDSLRNFDENDPVKYDIALFGMGVERIL